MMQVPADVDLVVMDDQLDFMNVYDEILYKNCASIGTVISMSSKCFPPNLKLFIDKWSLKRLECDSLQNMISLALTCDIPTK